MQVTDKVKTKGKLEKRKHTGIVEQVGFKSLFYRIRYTDMVGNHFQWHPASDLEIIEDEEKFNS